MVAGVTAVLAGCGGSSTPSLSASKVGTSVAATLAKEADQPTANHYTAAS